MEAAAEYGLRAIAALVILVGVIQFAILLVGTGAGVVALFVAGFAIVYAFSSGTVLLATEFLFPGSVAFPGAIGLLWLVGPVSLTFTVVFDLALEGFLIALFRRVGLYPPCARQIEALLRGPFLALALLAMAFWLPGVELSPAAALAAGLISAFICCYLGLWLGGTFPGDAAALYDEGMG